MISILQLIKIRTLNFFLRLKKLEKTLREKQETQKKILNGLRNR